MIRSTLREGGDGVAGLHLVLQEAELGPGGDLVDQLTVVGVGVHGQKLLPGDQVGGLRDVKQTSGRRPSPSRVLLLSRRDLSTTRR